MSYNQQYLQPGNFDGDPILKISEPIKIPLNQNTTQKHSMTIQQSELQTDDSFYSLGIPRFQQSIPFYSIIVKGTELLNDSEKLDRQLSLITFSMDSNVVEIERSLYTIWDYFGDIGGFNDFIRIVGSMIMSILTTLKGSGLD